MQPVLIVQKVKRKEKPIEVGCQTQSSIIHKNNCIENATQTNFKITQNKYSHNGSNSNSATFRLEIPEIMKTQDAEKHDLEDLFLSNKSLLKQSVDSNERRQHQSCNRTSVVKNINPELSALKYRHIKRNSSMGSVSKLTKLEDMTNSKGSKYVIFFYVR